MEKAILQQYVEGPKDDMKFGERLLVDGEEIFRFPAPSRFTANQFDYARLLLDALGDKVEMYLSATPDRGQKRNEWIDDELRRLQSLSTSHPSD